MNSFDSTNESTDSCGGSGTGGNESSSRRTVFLFGRFDDSPEPSRRSACGSIERTSRFKRDYKRVSQGRHGC